MLHSTVNKTSFAKSSTLSFESGSSHFTIMSNQFVVIMAGGRGERFWPQSRLKKPKHLLPIVGDTSMLGQTVERLDGMVPMENIFIITNSEQRAAVLEVCPHLLPANVIGEPIGRDTAAAVGLAMVLVKQRSADGVMAMLPADHVIHDKAGFQKVLQAGFKVATDNRVLVTIGIEPTGPATGYGYIHKQAVFAEVDDQMVYAVKRFVEKPDLKTAQVYVDAKEYFWNAGMFVWSVATIEAAFKNSAPDLHADLLKIEQSLVAGEDLASVLATHYPQLEKISIDYAIMEKADNVVTLPSAFDWDDVGEWPAIARHYAADAAGNVIKGDALCEQSHNNIIISPDGHMTALVGVDDCIVVRTADATLICPKAKAQDIKKLVKQLSSHEVWSKLV